MIKLLLNASLVKQPLNIATKGAVLIVFALVFSISAFPSVAGAQAAEEPYPSAVTETSAPEKPIEITIESALRIAAEQSYEVRAALAKIEQAGETIRLSGAPFLPRMSIDAGYTYIDPAPEVEINFETATPLGPIEVNRKLQLGYHHNMKVGLQVVQSAFAWWADYDNYQAALLGLDLAKLNLENTRAENQVETARLFYGLLLLDRRRALVERMLDQKERRLKLVSENYGGGVASEFEYLRTEVDLEAIRPQLDEINNQRSLAELALKRLLGMPLGQPIIITGQLKIEDRDIELDEAVKFARENNSALKMLDTQEQILTHRSDSEAARDKPTLALGGRVEYSNPYIMKEEWGLGFAMFAQASWTFFDGQVARAKSGQLRAQAEEISHNAASAKEKIAAGVEAAYLSMTNADKALVALDRAATLAEKANQIASAGYSGGTITNTDVLDAELALMEVKFKRLAVIYEKIMAEYQLRRVMGEALTPAESANKEI